MASVQTQTTPRRPQSKRPSYGAAAGRAGAQKFSYNLPFSRRLEISIRKFRTSPARRSKKFRQFIIYVNISQIREIAIAYHKRPGRRSPYRLSPVRFSPRTALAGMLLVAGAGLAIFFGAHLQKPAHFDITPSSKARALAPASAKSMPASVPTRLQIPKIGIDTDLSQVGLQANGSMEMPWDIGTAAWYKYSPTPGQMGPSVIVGHLDGANYANMTGIFYRLRELAPGDEFSISRADGSVANFKVIYLKNVSQTNFPTQEIYGNIKYAGVRLITCGGTFDSTITPTTP
jgi:sortase (surface protein transpeptidase)